VRFCIDSSSFAICDARPFCLPVVQSGSVKTMRRHQSKTCTIAATRHSFWGDSAIKSARFATVAWCCSDWTKVDVGLTDGMQENHVFRFRPAVLTRFRTLHFEERA
jgi:hypothetical protein